MISVEFIRRVFPNDEAATKLIYLAIQNIS